MDSCDDCGARAVVEDREQGYVVCTACGMVTDGRMVEAEEYNCVNDCGARPPRVNWARVARPVLPRVRGARKPRSLVAFDQGIRDAEDVLALTPAMCSTARDLFKSLTGAKVFRGRMTTGAVAVSVYCACKREGYARSVEEVCAAVGSDRDSFVRARQRMWGVDDLLRSQAYEQRVSDVL